MGLGHVELSEPVQLPPLQFGGGFIELAILFLLLAIVAGILGAGGIAGLLAVISFLLYHVGSVSYS